MKLKMIYTDRHYITWPSYHIIFEFEDEISETVGIPIFNSPMSNKKLFRKFMAYGQNF